MLSSGIPSLFHPQLPLFPPSASCSLRPPCPVWIDQTSYPSPFLLTPPSFPPTPTLLLPGLLVVCMGASGGDSAPLSL